MKKNISSGAFTLPELIIVVFILVIFGILGFGYYLGNIVVARDANRLAQLNELSESLNFAMLNASLPVPDNSISIAANGRVFYYQWYAWKNVIRKIKYNAPWLDPKDGAYFSYLAMKDKNFYQIMAYLELKNGKKVFNPSIPQTKSINYANRFLYTLWSPLGILVETGSNIPAQELLTGSVNITSLTWSYVGMFSNTQQISGANLIFVQPNYSCARIKEVMPLSKSGYYTVDPFADGTGLQVYCNM